MPLELLPLDKGPRILGPGDRGFLINLTKARWNNNASHQAIKLLRKFTQLYYETRCPEEKESKVVDPDEAKLAELEELDLEDNEESAPASQPTKEDKSGIDFAVRDMIYPNVGFVACNLADPSDFAHFVLTKLADINDYKRPRLPFRILPIQRVCEAKVKTVEQTVGPLLQETLGKDDHPHRFSLIYRSHCGGETLSKQEANATVRNCIWAMNPNCVQCIKYQDYAVVMDILDPLFVIGVAKDFQKLASYNTWIIRHGIKSDPTTDSEDDISDDPELDEEDNKRRKLRIKRKRRAEKAGLTQPSEESKKELKEDSGEDDINGDGGDNDDVAGALNEDGGKN